MTEPRPFRSQLFLFRMLAAIFVVEAGFLAFAFVKCSTPMPGNPVPLVNERCPKLGERSETLFIAAITTTLSLLTGAGVVVSQKKFSSDRDELSVSQAQSQGQASSPPSPLPSQPPVQPPVGGKAFEERKPPKTPKH